MKRILAALAAVVLATLAVASPAAAADPHHATGDWQLRDWTGAYPDVETSPAALSSATCDAVTLVKPDVPGDADPIYGPSSDGDVGTSYENTDLNLPVGDGYTLTVDYVLSEPGNAASGAVRMFWYDTADADTLHTAPTAQVLAPESTPGELSLTFSGASTIRTFGLTYDASNDTEGSVTFSNLRLTWLDESEQEQQLAVAFCAAPQPEETLPVTGSSLQAVVVGGIALVAIGATLLFLIRARRTGER